MIDATVIVAGGGPVGLTLAMELASRGIDVLVIERRERAEPPSVKCNHISARSMEIFRRLGVADELREAGMPSDHPHDAAYRVSFLGRDEARTVLPSVEGRRHGEAGADTWWPTPEPPHRINQLFTEPILTRHACAMEGIRLLNRTEVVAVEQDAEAVAVNVRHVDDGAVETLRARFLVGCDGPRSTVRHLIGATFNGPPGAGHTQSTLIRAPGLTGAQERPAWTVGVWNGDRHGNVIAIDGIDRFLVHNLLKPGEKPDEVDRDAAIRSILGAGPDFEYEQLSIEDYVGRGLVADRFRDRRILLAGDAAHLWLPFAGYGMNAGLADAQDLGWLLAAHVAGWLSDTALAAYERERRPVTLQVMDQAMAFLPHLIALGRSVPSEIREEGPSGDAARSAFFAQAATLNTQQYAAAGLNFGYCYDDSPLIAHDQERPPAFSMGEFTPSTVPGCRVPHAWLDQGQSLLDALDPRGFTLVHARQPSNGAPLSEALGARGIPVTEIEIPAEAGGTFDRAMVLVRPDAHVAWRGDAIPDDVERLVDILAGVALPAGVSQPQSDLAYNVS
jgi:2-polyprenyl-6-methoxyphenol hydroxylase-like FAD-dependent oxidoreductase